MLPRPLFRSAESITPQMAADMARVVDLEYKAATGKENKMPKSSAPVVCASTAGIQGFWSLECNDPDINPSTLQLIVGNLQKWEASRVLQ